MTNNAASQKKPAIEPLDADDISQIIELAWADEVSFDAIAAQFGLAEPQVIELMRKQLKAKSFKNWRARVTGRVAKHAGLNGLSRGAHAANALLLAAHGDNAHADEVPSEAFGDDAPRRNSLS